jgi:hypothetical protein
MKSKLELNKHNTVIPVAHGIRLERAGSSDKRKFTIFMAESVDNNTSHRILG